MSTVYFEDIELHKKHISREYILSEEEIIDFARKWDPALFHIDPDAAKKSKFGGLVAAGIHLVAICMKLANEAESRPAYTAGAGWDEIRFVTPSRPGDSLVFEIEASSKRESRSDPKIGVVSFVNRLLNQRGETVVTFKATGLVERRPKV